MNADTKTEPQAQQATLSRRKLLKTASVLGAASIGAVAFRAQAQETGHAHHEHHEHDHKSTDGKLQAVIDASMGCVKQGEACLDHCLELFKAGDTSVAACADTVMEMLASCTAMSKLASYNSKHLKAFMTACIGVCEDCETECRKHAEMHARCKACAESCAACIKACKAYLG